MLKPANGFACAPSRPKWASTWSRMKPIRTGLSLCSWPNSPSTFHQVLAKAANRSISSATAVLAPGGVAAASAIGDVARYEECVPAAVDKC